jgi:hypothetical protein
MTTHEQNGVFGIGAQVYVQAASIDDPSPWPDEPTGIIVGAGGAAINRVTNTGGPTRMWVVEFDSPQTHLDGTPDHAGAQVHEKYLHLAPPVDASTAEAWSAEAASIGD